MCVYIYAYTQGFTVSDVFWVCLFVFSPKHHTWRSPYFAELLLHTNPQRADLPTEMKRLYLLSPFFVCFAVPYPKFHQLFEKHHTE